MILIPVFCLFSAMSKMILLESFRILQVQQSLEESCKITKLKAEKFTLKFFINFQILAVLCLAAVFCYAEAESYAGPTPFFFDLFKKCECRDYYTKKCTPVKEKKCEVQYKEKCEQHYKEECHDEQKQKCETIYKGNIKLEFPGSASINSKDIILNLMIIVKATM